MITSVASRQFDHRFASVERARVITMPRTGASVSASVGSTMSRPLPAKKQVGLLYSRSRPDISR